MILRILKIIWYDSIKNSIFILNLKNKKIEKKDGESKKKKILRKEA